jgi:hypothetical protein
MEGLIKKGLVDARVTGDKWILPSDEDGPVVPDGYVISFMHITPQNFYFGLLFENTK